MGGAAAGLPRPEADVGRHLVALLALPEVGVAVAEHLRVAILGQEGEHARLPAAPLGDVVLIHEFVAAGVGDRVEFQIPPAERSPALPLFSSCATLRRGRIGHENNVRSIFRTLRSGEISLIETGINSLELRLGVGG